MTTQRSLGNSLLRVIPSFAVLSLFGCVVGRFVFWIPHGELGVVVSVQLVLFFLLTRALALAAPHDLQEPGPPNVGNLVWAVPFALSGCASAVMFPASLIYLAIGLPNVAKGASEIAWQSLVVALVSFSFGLTLAFTASITATDMLRFLRNKSASLFWSALRIPAWIPDYWRFLGSH